MGCSSAPGSVLTPRGTIHLIGPKGVLRACEPIGRRVGHEFLGGSDPVFKRLAWPLIVVASSVVMFATVREGGQSSLRTVITVWFFLICPGMPYILSLRLGDGLTEWTLAIALSLAIDTIVSMTILFAGIWDFKLGMIITTAIAWVGVGLHLARMVIPTRPKPEPEETETAQ